MLRRLLLVLASILPAAAPAVAPGAFLGELPPLPADACRASQPQKSAYLRSVEALVHRIDAEQARRAKETRAKRDALLPAARQQRLDAAGLGPADQETLKHGTHEEKQALAMRMLRGEAGKGGGLPAGPDLAALQRQAQEQRRLQAERQPLDRAIAEEQLRFAEELQQIDRDPEARDLRDSQLPPLYRRLDELTGAGEGPGAGGSAAARASVQAQIRALEDRYCERLSTRQLGVLSRYLGTTKREVDDAARIEKLRARQVRGATGMAGEVEEPGAQGVGLVRTYAGHLRSVFKYDIRREAP
jgi:hypothetical protein